MDHEPAPLSQLEPDDFKQVARRVGCDGQNTRWIGVGLEIGHHDSRIDRMADELVRRLQGLTWPTWRRVTSGLHPASGVLTGRRTVPRRTDTVALSRLMMRIPLAQPTRRR